MFAFNFVEIGIFPEVEKSLDKSLEKSKGYVFHLYFFFSLFLTLSTRMDFFRHPVDLQVGNRACVFSLTRKCLAHVCADN